MTTKDALINAAISWFNGHRPINFTKPDHLKVPTVNCTTARECLLAEAVAAYLKRGENNETT